MAQYEAGCAYCCQFIEAQLCSGGYGSGSGSGRTGSGGHGSGNGQENTGGSCGRCHYVGSGPGSGSHFYQNPTQPIPPDIWINVADIPHVCPGSGSGSGPASTLTFIYTDEYGNSWKYEINASWTQDKPPHNALVLGSLPNCYVSCSAAPNAGSCPPAGAGSCPGGSGSQGSGGSGGGGGGPQGFGGEPDGGGGGNGQGASAGSGSGSGSGPCGNQVSGWPAYLCQDYTGSGSGPPDPVFVICDAKIPSGVWYFRYLGYCYSVDATGPCECSEPGEQLVSIGSSYKSCEDCEGGTPAVLCPDQESGSFPNLWVRQGEIPTGSTPYIWRQDNFCWSVSPGASTGTIPPDATLTTPADDYPNCITCVLGIVATLCLMPNGSQQPNYTKAPVVWVPVASLPPDVTTPIIFNVQGWCYWVNPEGSGSGGAQVPMPTGALVTTAIEEYASCLACLCGQRMPSQGIPSQWCGAGVVVSGYVPPVFWLLADNIGDDDLFFVQDGGCYYFDVSQTPSNIPSGAQIIDPSSTYGTCEDCLNSQGSGSGPGSGTSGSGSGSGPPPCANCGPGPLPCEAPTTLVVDMTQFAAYGYTDDTTVTLVISGLCGPDGIIPDNWSGYSLPTGQAYVTVDPLSPGGGIINCYTIGVEGISFDNFFGFNNTGVTGTYIQDCPIYGGPPPPGGIYSVEVS